MRLFKENVFHPFRDGVMGNVLQMKTEMEKMITQMTRIFKRLQNNNLKFLTMQVLKARLKNKNDMIQRLADTYDVEIKSLMRQMEVMKESVHMIIESESDYISQQSEEIKKIITRLLLMMRTQRAKHFDEVSSMKRQHDKEIRLLMDNDQNTNLIKNMSDIYD